MTIKAEETIRSGDLKQALTELQNCVRDDPSNAKYRVFLFQLLCLTGDWERALTQLNTAADLDPSTLLLAQTYRELLLCEGFRTCVFEGSKAPLIFGEPPDWMGRLIQSLSSSSGGDGVDARKSVDHVLEQVPEISGSVDGVAFEWLCDADMRLGPVIEAVIAGRYYWIPFSNIAQINFSEPVDLRDLVWLPAEFRWTNEGETIGFIPVRYPGQQTLDNAQCAMARKTEWRDIGGEFYLGSGQRNFASADVDFPLLEMRSLTFDHSVSN